MKIAVAFFGLPRCSDIAWPSIEQKIYAQLPFGAEVRSFYHFYQQSQVVNPRSGENGSLEASNYQPFEKFTGELQDPQKVLAELPFEELKQFGDSWKDDFNSLRNLLLQLNSLKRVTTLLTPFAPDVVVYVRPDLVYHDAFPKHVFLMAAEIHAASFIPNWQWGIGLNDRFSVCGKEAYQAYGNRINLALTYCSEKKEPLHAERLLKFALERADATILQLFVTASRVRIGGVLAKESFKNRISLFSPLTNRHKRFFFLTGLKTKFLTYRFLKK